MHVFLMIILIVFLSSSYASAQDTRSAYAGQEQREIKFLSHEEIEGYLTGQGMGLAKAGELNHYPGPKHVLDLADELQLTEEQLNKTLEIYNKMHEEAVTLGKRIVEKEKLLDELFVRGEIDEKQLASIVSEIGGLKGALRITHLRAHLQMKDILTPHQIRKYDELRGYGASDMESGRHQHGHSHH